jgi:DNA-binding response OmpR family regulator
VKQEENISHLRRVLCVEDDHDTCDVLRFVMTDYEFTAVHSIKDARNVIGEGSYDLYVLDNWLPDGSGIELCEKIRADGNSRPIVFTSAIGQRQEIELAMSAGADRYLVKPYEPEALLRIVKELLDPSGQLTVKS